MPSIARNAKLKTFEGEIVRRISLAMTARQIGVPELKERLEKLTGWEAGSSVYQWFKRKAMPSGPVTAALPRALGVSADWLFFGEGSMDVEPAGPQQQWIRGVQYAAARMAQTTHSLQGEVAQFDVETHAGFPSGLAPVVRGEAMLPIQPRRRRG